MSARRRARRAARRGFARLVPGTLMHYPFEAFAAVYGLLAGLAVLVTAHGVPEPMRAVLSPLVVRLWAVTLVLAALTIALGLKRRWRLALPVGLRLLAISLGTFVIGAAWTSRSVDLVPALVLVSFIAYLALCRGAFLRAAAEVKHQARMEKARG